MQLLILRERAFLESHHWRGCPADQRRVRPFHRIPVRPQGDHAFPLRTCGIKPFGRGEMENTGVFYGINLACLDDLTPEELLAAPLEYQDGKHDHWERAPEEVRHL